MSTNTQKSNDGTATTSGDLLARAFLDILTDRQDTKSNRMLKTYENDDPEDNDLILDVLDDLSHEENTKPVRIQPQIAAAAVLVARAVETMPGLIRQFKRKTAIISMHVPDVDFLLHVQQVLIDCALPQRPPTPDFVSRRRGRDTDARSFTIAPRYALCVRDGSAKNHNPMSGNEEVTEQVFEGKTVIGISTDPKRYLPRDLMRVAEHHLRLPTLDLSALNLIIEATVGKPSSVEFDEKLLRLVTSADLSLAIRREFTPEECIGKLREVMEKKDEFSQTGPKLEEMFGFGTAKEWGLNLVSDMEEFKAGNLSWSEFDHRGLLLSGFPGTGKTSFARALAKSANVPIIATSVSAWNSEGDHLGHTLMAMRNAFHRAQQAAPCILFIDELDGISSRDNLDTRHREYWVQIVNQLLELLQGFEERTGVVVLGATNHPEQIDPAVLRAGRLDRIIHIDLPDTEAMRDIYRFYLADTLDETELMPLATASRGKSGADVKAYVSRAKAKARREQRSIVLNDIMFEIRAGRPEYPKEIMRCIAVHEAGHAVANLHFNIGTLKSVEISASGGATVHQTERHSFLQSKACDDFLVILMCGAAAEEVVIGSTTIGSSYGPNNDLQKATELATQLEMAWQVGKPAPLTMSLPEETLITALPELRGRVQQRLNKAAEAARALIKSKRDQVDLIADELERRHYLSGEEVTQILNQGLSIDVETSHEAA